MNIQDIKKVIPILLRNSVVPFLWGPQGVGKTQVMRQIAKEEDMGFIPLHLATQEVGDLVGLLIPTKDGTVKHSRPEWFPTEGKGVVFLDELNRAHPDVLQAMFSFITEGTIHTHKLPEGWRVAAAGNYQNNSFTVTDTSDAAWMSRFCHIDFVPTPEEFIVYAEDQNMFTVADFIRTHPELLETKTKDRPAMALVTPDRRSWEGMIGRLELESELENNRFEVYSGIIGATAASMFMTYKAKNYNRLSGKKILKKYADVKEDILGFCSKKETRFDVLNSAVEEIFAYLPGRELPEEELENFKSFLLDVPLELGLKIVKNLQYLAWAQRNSILNNAEFVKRFERAKLK